MRTTRHVLRDSYAISWMIMVWSGDRFGLVKLDILCALPVPSGSAAARGDAGNITRAMTHVKWNLAAVTFARFLRLDPVSLRWLLR